MVEKCAKQETSTNQAACRYIAENKLFITTAERACVLTATCSGQLELRSVPESVQACLLTPAVTTKRRRTWILIAESDGAAAIAFCVSKREEQSCSPWPGYVTAKPSTAARH
jgi:hypothetical protein